MRSLRVTTTIENRRADFIFGPARLLFRRADLSEIKRYCIDEWTKILQGKISFQDLIISKEVKLGSYSENGLPPPGAVIAGRRLAEDPMDEAEYGERVPFIITKHGASDRLVHKARAPEDLLNDRQVAEKTGQARMR